MKLLTPLLLSIASATIIATQVQSQATGMSVASESTATHRDDSEREAVVSGRLIPVPYLYLGPSLMGAGYAPIAYRAEGGLSMEGNQIIFRALGAYDNGHKINDNDQPNPSGHDRYLESALYFRPGWSWSRTLYFGGGYRWNELSTANYIKGAGRYEIGGGLDWSRRSCESCRRDFSMRVNVDWITAGQDWQNGSHGPATTITFPSPRENRHWFFRETVAVYRLHTTVTDPSNLLLTQQQRADKQFDNVSGFGIVYRF
jgi:hypothetical protein